MNREQLIITTALVLFAAFVAGWFASWLVGRLIRPSRAAMSELDRMAHNLHEAEEARDRAIAMLEDREADLSAQLHATQGELASTMEVLNDRRLEIEELRDYIENKLARR